MASAKFCMAVNFDVMRGETMVILGDRVPGRARCCARWWDWKSPAPARSGSKGKNIAALSTEEMDDIRKASECLFRAARCSAP